MMSVENPQCPDVSVVSRQLECRLVPLDSLSSEHLVPLGVENPQRRQSHRQVTRQPRLVDAQACLDLGCPTLERDIPAVRVMHPRHFIVRFGVPTDHNGRQPREPPVRIANMGQGDGNLRKPGRHPDFRTDTGDVSGTRVQRVDHDELLDPRKQSTCGRGPGELTRKPLDDTPDITRAHRAAHEDERAIGMCPLHGHANDVRDRCMAVALFRRSEEPHLATVESRQH